MTSIATLGQLIPFDLDKKRRKKRRRQYVLKFHPFITMPFSHLLKIWQQNAINWLRFEVFTVKKSMMFQISPPSLSLSLFLEGGCFKILALICNKVRYFGRIILLPVATVNEAQESIDCSLIMHTEWAVDRNYILLLKGSPTVANPRRFPSQPGGEWQEYRSLPISTSL